MGRQKTIIWGHLGRDPEVSYGKNNGTAVAKFSVAVGEYAGKDAQGNKQEHTEWFNCVAFDKTADRIGEYLRKGAKVYIEGRLQTRKYKDKQGVERTWTDLRVDVCDFLDPRDGSRAETKRELESAKEKLKRDPDYQPDEGGFIDDDLPF